MLNEIRDQIRERLPAIIDFTLYAMTMATIAAVLLGLVWVYINCGPALFVVALGLIWLASGFAGRRAPAYFDGDGRLTLGSNDGPALPPPGMRPLPPPGTRALTPTVRSAGRKALPPR